MCCTLDSSYIEYSNSTILETLKSCSDLTEAQAAAVVALLERGETQYGYVNRRLWPFGGFFVCFSVLFSDIAQFYFFIYYYYIYISF